MIDPGYMPSDQGKTLEESVHGGNVIVALAVLFFSWVVGVGMGFGLGWLLHP